MSKTWVERQTASPEARRMYEQERMVLWTTEKICEAMEEAGISKADLAALLGTSRANISTLLGGGRNMTLRTLADVAFVTGHRVEVAFEPLRQGEYISTPVRMVRSLRPQHVPVVVSSEAGDMVGPEALFDDPETLAA